MAGDHAADVRRRSPVLKREWPWLATTALIDILLYLLAEGLAARGPEKLIIIITATSLLALIRLVYELSEGGEADTEVLLDVDSALHRARAMQKLARDSVFAMWTLFPYDPALKEYFRKTLANGLYTRRLIDIAHARLDDIADHLWESRDHIIQGTYRIDIVRNISFEVLIVDHSEAAVFHYPGRGIGCLFARHQEKRFVNVVEGIFESLCENGTAVPLEILSSRADITTWLNEHSGA